MEPATTAWIAQVRKVLASGDRVAPRGKETVEIRRSLVEYDARSPVVVEPGRKLSWKFLSGEALWILSGSDKVEDIAPYNKKIAEYSDDGRTFFGAYGPRVISQVGSVVSALAKDADSRQAVISIWRENPPETKDVPCTVALHFQIRRSILDVIAFMRSSDVWLGLPYDMFNFAVVGWRVAAELNDRGRGEIRPGRVSIFAASSHIYIDDVERATEITRPRKDDDQVMEIIDADGRASLRKDTRVLSSYAGFEDVIDELTNARDEDRPPRLSLL